METVGLGFCYEDLPVGREFRTIGRTVTETDITNFVSVTGMLEVLFINSDFREKESNIDGFAAPGALVYTFMEGLLTQSTMQHTGFAFLEMELKVLGPTFAGDTIHCEVEVIESRRSKSLAEPRPGSDPEQGFQTNRGAGAGLHAPADDQGTHGGQGTGRGLDLFWYAAQVRSRPNMGGLPLWFCQYLVASRNWRRRP